MIVHRMAAIAGIASDFSLGRGRFLQLLNMSLSPCCCVPQKAHRSGFRPFHAATFSSRYSWCRPPGHNRGRPHLSLGPGIPEPAAAFLPWQGHDRHSFAQDCRVASREDSAASITNTAGKGSPREGREELRGHCALIALQFSNTCTDGKAGAFRLRRDEWVGVRSRWFLSDPGSSPARARIQQLRRLSVRQRSI